MNNTNSYGFSIDEHLVKTGKGGGDIPKKFLDELTTNISASNTSSTGGYAALSDYEVDWPRTFYYGTWRGTAVAYIRGIPVFRLRNSATTGIPYLTIAHMDVNNTSATYHASVQTLQFPEERVHHGTGVLAYNSSSTLVTGIPEPFNNKNNLFFIHAAGDLPEATGMVNYCLRSYMTSNGDIFIERTSTYGEIPFSYQIILTGL